MKCLIIQSNNPNADHQFLRECLSLQYSLNHWGIITDIWGLRYSNYEIEPKFGDYDLILIVENYEMDWIPDLSIYKNTIKLQWIIDLHCGIIDRYFKVSSYSDVILHSTKSLMSTYQTKFPNKKHIWFPNAFDHRYFNEKSSDETKLYDIIFVGNMLSRASILRKMQNKIGLKLLTKYGQNMIDTIRHTKINFNKSISSDVNYRVFETIGLGVCLFTNKLKEMGELGFIDGFNCVMYSNTEEAVIKYHQLIINDNWMTIGKNGLILSKKHSYTQRIKSLLIELQDIGYFINKYLIKNKSIDEFWNVYWLALHSFSLNYPEMPTSEDKLQLSRLLDKMRLELPCNNCKQHLNEYMNSNYSDEVTSSRTSIVNFFIDLHNHINNLMGKTAFSYNEAITKYQDPNILELLKSSYNIDLISMFYDKTLGQFPELMSNKIKCTILHKY